jgi:hypothetical protein
MFLEQIRAFFVIKNAAKPVALTVRREPRSHTRLAHRIYVDSQIDHLRQQVIPPAVRRAKKSVLAERRFASRIDTEIQQ